MKKSIFHLLLFTVCVSTNAQISNMLHKAKNKVEQKAKDNKEEKLVPIENKTVVTNPPVNENKNSQPVVNENKYTNSKDGAIYFSTEANVVAAKNAADFFKSNQTIYGKLVLNEGTLKNYFKIPEKDAVKKRPYNFLYYITELWKGGEMIKSNSQVWTTCFVADEFLEKNYFNFDILPNPDNVQTVLKPLDDFTGGSSGASLINWVDQYTFSTEGVYTIKIKFTYPQTDVWGKRTDEKTWPTITNEFTLNFSNSDVPALLAKKSKINDAAAWVIIKAQPMPLVWAARSNPVNSSHSADGIKTAYKTALSYWGNDVTVIKLYADGGSGTTIIKDNYGLPVRKSYNQQYVAFCKKTSTGHCFYQDFYIFNQYSGAGTYSKSITVGMYDAVYVTCDKMK
jgi:hypothetical protein